MKSRRWRDGEHGQRDCLPVNRADYFDTIGDRHGRAR